MNKNKLVSVVLPTYNGSKFIRESIDSVIAQTYTNWELIIVNDCSTDDTLDIINEYVQKDSRIRVISNSTNMKLPASLNIGFEDAKGEYYTWTSDDNIYHHDALEYMVDFLDNNTIYDLVCCDYELIEENGEFRQIHSELYPHKFVELSRNAVVGACFLYTKEIAKKVGKYSETTFGAEDYDYWCRLALIGNIYFSDKVLYKYRFNSESLTSTRQDIIPKQIAKIRRQYSLRILNKSGLTDKQRRKNLLNFYMERNDSIWLYIALKDSIFCFLYVLIMSWGLRLYEELSFIYTLSNNKNKNIAFWGASIYLEKLIKKYYISGKQIVGIIDKDSNKWGKKLGNYMIYSPEQIPELNIDKIIFTVKNKNRQIYPKVQNELKNYSKIELVPNLFINPTNDYDK